MAEAPRSDGAAEAALTCPLCGYDLRGLPENRCPECGHAFDPAALRAERDGGARWQFEEAPRRLAISFARTALATLRPFRFWTRLHAADSIVPRRLVTWTLIWIGLAAGAFLLAFALAATLDYLHVQQLAGRLRLRGRALDTTVAGAIGRALLGSGLTRTLWMVFAIMIWPLMAVLASQAFGITLRRARIHRGHLWRCVLYAWPVTALPCLAAVLVQMFGYGYAWPFREIVRAMPKLAWQLAEVWHVGGFSLLMTALAAVLSTAHLIAAHVRYLRLPHAAAQAILVQVLAWLGIASIVHGFSML